MANSAFRKSTSCPAHSWLLSRPKDKFQSMSWKETDQFDPKVRVQLLPRGREGLRR